MKIELFEIIYLINEALDSSLSVIHDARDNKAEGKESADKSKREPTIIVSVTKIIGDTRNITIKAKVDHSTDEGKDRDDNEANDASGKILADLRERRKGVNKLVESSKENAKDAHGYSSLILTTNELQFNGVATKTNSHCEEREV